MCTNDCRRKTNHFSDVFCNPLTSKFLLASLLLVAFGCGAGGASDDDVVDSSGDSTDEMKPDSDSEPDRGTNSAADDTGDVDTTLDSTDSNEGTGEAGLVEGCEGQWLRVKPDGLDEEGPWPVGAITTKVDKMTIEVWYPGKIGSEAGSEGVTYDIREYLPNPGKVSDEENPLQHCNCYRDLPLDTEAGPYPVVVYVHGTAGLRTQNLEQMTHWASRGFVVVAADHPNVCFRDIVKNPLGTLGGNQAGDARRIFKKLIAPDGELAFLAGHIDTTRQGIMGHSIGARAVRGFGDIAQVVISYAGSAGLSKPADSGLFIAGDADTVGGTISGYDGASPIKRAVLVEAGGHLVGGSLCVLRDPTDPGRDLLDILQEKNIGGLIISMARGMFQGCNELANDDDGEYINELTGIEIFNFATTGVLEETLHCSEDASAKLSTIVDTFDGYITSFSEELQ